jgi:hypothetical protein
MKKYIILKIVLVLIIVLIIVFSFIKTSTNIYIGNYSYYGRSIDIQLKIDDILILNDSLYNNPFGCINIKEKLGYGIHKINVSSKKANVNQEKKIFLFFNQYINIEFLDANTLFDSFPTDTLFFKDGSYFSKICSENLSENTDTINCNNQIMINEKSYFIIETSFNPFYYE